MPNFHAHWLVALQTIDGLPKAYAYLRSGRKTYLARSRDLGLAVRDLARGILDRLDLDGAANLQDAIRKKVTDWENTLRTDADAICFSAFMLGACGPDFWMLPCDPTYGTFPDFAPHHFDLGHYNRTHLQFEVSRKRVAKRDDLGARVEKSYFLGMATHLAADLVLHQLVNVSAGAYNLLKMGAPPFKGVWSNEQGHELLTPGATPEGGNAAQRGVHRVGEGIAKTAGDAAWLWTTHNKVEHYWDTWVRYRWLGDFGKVWPDDVEAPFPVAGLPLCDTLRRDLLGRTDEVAGLGNTIGHYATDFFRGIGRALPGDDTKNERATVIDRLDYALGSVETRWLLEKPLAFPWLFSDAVLRGACRPFIYDRVVDKQGGAYPEALVFAKAKTEAEHAQMSDPAPGEPADREEQQAGPARSEKRKLQFFSTRRNAAMPPSSWNFLNYLTCPNLVRLRRFGQDAFYDRRAFPPFTAKALNLSRAFAGGLAGAYAAEGPLGKLAQFWNLDTGLGLRIQDVSPPDRDRHEVVTRIDWIHALGPAGIGEAIDYRSSVPPGYARSMKAQAQEPYPLRGWQDSRRAFGTYAPGPFENLGAVVEDASVVGDRRYLAELRLRHPLRAKETAPVFRRLEGKNGEMTDADFEEQLFADDSGPSPGGERVDCPTGEKAKARTWTVEHRLDLVVRASIARLGAQPGGVAMYLLGDSAGDVQPPESEDREDDASTAWLRTRSQILDRVLEPGRDDASERSGLATFSARILLNLSKDKEMARVVAPAGKWNNVVPYRTHQGHYGRNFAVATARTHVLRGSNKRPPYDFDPTTDFTVLEDLALTEHCFFTLVPLVKMPDGWIDAFSKEPVTRDAFAAMKKVEAINFVKIVLLYVVDRGGVQLRWCYLDGVRTRVHRVPA